MDEWPMGWSDSVAVKGRLQRYWQRGDFCRAAVSDTGLFPLTIALKQPSAAAMVSAFPALQLWVKGITAFAERHGLQLSWRTVNHRTLGRQQLPTAVEIASVEAAAAILGKGGALKRFTQLYRATLQRAPALQPWLLKRPLKVLELEAAWLRLVEVACWLQAHPRPRIYLRQVSLPGVDSKMIEAHRKVLSELFDLLLPPFAIDDEYHGTRGFARRYGFRDKPAMVRLRPLDTNLQLLCSDGEQDVMITAAAFARLPLRPKRLVITENEVNYLAFPDLPESLILFGAGYGFEALAAASWLQETRIHYWGDLDTHGFAILDQLRSHYPHAESLLMDRETLIAHKDAWGQEPKPERRDLPHLNAAEATLYDDLREDRMAPKLRLEQERVDFAFVERAVAALGVP